MRNLFLLLLLFSCSTGFSQLNLGYEKFSLRNIDGRMISFSSYPEAKGFIVVFTCNHCPFAKLYSERLNELNKQYAPLGIPLLAFNPMDSLLYKEESFYLMKRKAENDHFNFPYLQDQSQIAAKYFNAQHTPQVFIVWKENDKLAIKYKGAIDDNGDHPELAHSYIQAAVDALLKNEVVPEAETPSFGCKIYYRK
jgi:thiol-disulfide isomerase/thioredoxin